MEVLIQLHPVAPPTNQAQMDKYERELEDPQGISTIRGPPLMASMRLYSNNCELLLSANKVKGLKIDKYYSKAVYYAVFASILALSQVFLLIRQMEKTATPSV